MESFVLFYRCWSVLVTSDVFVLEVLECFSDICVVLHVLECFSDVICVVLQVHECFSDVRCVCFTCAGWSVLVTSCVLFYMC